jgi:NAD(P)-dependent dehydrogenase (short-subunit alcohol dehydrogenase family)
LRHKSGKTYDEWAAYGQSKTANNLFSMSLAKKLGTAKGLIAVSLCPGAVTTNLGNAMGMKEYEALSKPSALVDTFKGRLSNIKFSCTVKADRAQGHSQFWVDDLSALFKTMEQGVATHVFAAFHPSISATGKFVVQLSYIQTPLC